MRPLKLWQRNVIGAVAAAASLGVLVATDLAPQWSDYRASVDPAAEAAPRQSVELHGQTWSVDEIRHLGRQPQPPVGELPPGTVVTMVTLQRSGPPGPQGCFAALTDGRHRWRGQPVFLYQITPNPDAATTCADPGPVQWAFVIPEDVVPTAVDVTALDGSIQVRLQL